ncbi:hypothetical protein K1T35_47775 (plasmid) [Pseudonocardia sp. DSM 110487]|uniref:hypothetical protein n=1 Tax=Pseudonocardia sp. DSM 110487 TaxID=2865833 RepID=UPI001C69F497|nr:hypothetical protein [Pseudonocardia sp. DSM 110487]QYN41051.1 hypothetical protein K1T35_47775 [Pseudonocardia sp. DSM 110487]
MTKTEAADIIGTDVLVWSRQTGAPITRSLVEARMWEMGGGHLGGRKKEAVDTGVSGRTVLVYAKRNAL